MPTRYHLSSCACRSLRVTDTYWYLTGTPELLGAASKRLEKRWDGLNAGCR
jgi:hypothetical protein